MATGQETEDGSRLLASFPKNGRGEEVQVRTSVFRGKDMLSVRVWFPGDDGELRPGRNGLALRTEQLPALRAALDQAATVLEAEGGAK